MINGKIECGIAYYGYGIEPSITIDNVRTLWIGFGRKSEAIDLYDSNTTLKKDYLQYFMDHCQMQIKNIYVLSVN